jgi:hypothetical protein
VTVLAVAAWVLPFALLTALVAVPGDDWSAATVAVLVGALALLCAAAAGPHILKRRLSSRHAHRYHRVNQLTASLCCLFLFLVLTAKQATHADWGAVSLYGLGCLCYLYILSTQLRQRRGGASTSPDSA